MTWGCDGATCMMERATRAPYRSRGTPYLMEPWAFAPTHGRSTINPPDQAGCSRSTSGCRHYNNGPAILAKDDRLPTMLIAPTVHLGQFIVKVALLHQLLVLLVQHHIFICGTSTGTVSSMASCIMPCVPAPQSACPENWQYPKAWLP